MFVYIDHNDVTFKFNTHFFFTKNNLHEFKKFSPYTLNKKTQFVNKKFFKFFIKTKFNLNIFKKSKFYKFIYL